LQIAWSPIGSFWIWLKPRGLDQLMAVASPPAIKNWGLFVDDCLAKRTQKQQELESNPKPEAEVRKDFFHWLFKAQDPDTGEGYSLPELYAECELLTIAGSDTTAIVLSAAFFYLARNPDVQAKLAQEIRSAFGSYDEIKSGNTITSCKYLTAFLQEAMRMSPPVGAEPPREVMNGGSTIGGHFFPPGAYVSTGLWAMVSFQQHTFDFRADE
jgi:cytochrome P450